MNAYHRQWIDVSVLPASTLPTGGGASVPIHDFLPGPDPIAMNRSDDAFGAPTRQTTISPLVISCILVAFAFIPDLQAPQSTTWFVLTASVVALCWRLWVDQASIRWGIPATCVLLFYGCQAVAVVNYGELRDLGAALFSAAVVTLIILLSSSFHRRQINVLINGILALSVVELGFALAEQTCICPRHMATPAGSSGPLSASIHCWHQLPGARPERWAMPFHSARSWPSPRC